MDKISTDRSTNRLTGRKDEKAKNSPIRAAREDQRADSGSEGGFFTQILAKMGFEAHFDEIKAPDLSPGRMWGGMKNAAANTRSVILNKHMSFDKPLFIIVLVLVVVGFTMMASASYAYAFAQYGDSMRYIRKQIVFAVLGVLAMIVISTVPPEKFKGFISYFIWGMSIVLLGIVLVLPGNKGVHRWINLGFTTVQPSEIAKFAAILVCSTYIAYHYREINMTTYSSLELKHRAARSKKFKWIYGLYRNFQTAVWPFIWRILPILVLLVLEPHLSCTIIILLIVGTLMFLGGTRSEYFVTLLVLAAIAIILIVFLGVVPYGRTRVEMWLDPFADAKGDGWQTVQSLYAISSGGLFGAGFGNSRQKYMYIAEPQNDFIFAVVCEELGLVGAVVIILIFVAFIWRGFVLSVANPDRFQRFVGIGITAQIGYQMILNVAVVSNLVPNTGISLPFFSSGGTSLLMLLAEIGVLLAISRSSPNKIV